MDQYLLIPFLVGWTSMNPSYFDVNYRGTRVLTHCHFTSHFGWTNPMDCQFNSLQVVWALWSTSARRDEVLRRAAERGGAGPGPGLGLGSWWIFLGFADDDDDDDADDDDVFFPMGNPRLCESIGHLVDFVGCSLSKFESFQGVCYGNSTFYHPIVGDLPSNMSTWEIAWESNQHFMVGFSQAKGWFQWRCKLVGGFKQFLFSRTYGIPPGKLTVGPWKSPVFDGN